VKPCFGKGRGGGGGVGGLGKNTYTTLSILRGIQAAPTYENFSSLRMLKVCTDHVDSLVGSHRTDALIKRKPCCKE
jgi:hypothetical protein